MQLTCLFKSCASCSYASACKQTIQFSPDYRNSRVSQKLFHLLLQQNLIIPLKNLEHSPSTWLNLRAPFF